MSSEHGDFSCQHCMKEMILCFKALENLFPKLCRGLRTLQELQIFLIAYQTFFILYTIFDEQRAR